MTEPCGSARVVESPGQAVVAETIRAASGRRNGNNDAASPPCGRCLSPPPRSLLPRNEGTGALQWNACQAAPPCAGRLTGFRLQCFLLRSTLHVHHCVCPAGEVGIEERVRRSSRPVRQRRTLLRRDEKSSRSARRPGIAVYPRFKGAPSHACAASARQGASSGTRLPIGQPRASHAKSMRLSGLIFGTVP